MGKRDRPRPRAGRLMRLLLGALILVLGMVWLSLLPVGPSSKLIPLALAHALPVRSDPAPGATLRKPPSQVTIWYDDALVQANSHISVLDPKGNEVDRRDSHLNGSNPREMSVTLAKLSAGTYTVLWVAQSADDGHITEGSFVFSVTLPDGTVPPLPTGAPPADGGTGSGTSFVLNGPILLQALATWLALLTPGTQDDPDLARASWAASRRFHRLVPYALGTVLLADVALLLGQAAAVTGNLSSAFAISSLQSILFSSHFGLFWWIRQFVVLAATGPLLATVHMTSFEQFLTTPYGWTLAVKIECFLLMVAISTYHAFFLRPRLAHLLAPSTPGVPGLAQVEMASAGVSGKALSTSGSPEMPSWRSDDQDDERNVGQTRRLAERMEVWLQREAALGGTVLLCTALLAVVFAGTLPAI